MKNKKNCNHAKWYDFFFGRFVRSLGREATLLGNFEKDASLLDVACGTGEQALIYAENCASLRGLDLCEESLELAIKKAENKQCKHVQFLCGNATKMPFADKEFDYSSICLGLHAMNSSVRDAVIREMKRVTKERIILIDYAKSSEENPVSNYTRVIIWAIEKFTTDKNHYTNFLNFMNNGGLLNLVEKHNLQLEEAKGHYGFSILKLSVH